MGGRIGQSEVFAMLEGSTATVRADEPLLGDLRLLQAAQANGTAEPYPRQLHRREPEAA